MPPAPILVLNSGSSSLKFGVFTPSPSGDEQPFLTGGADALNRPDGTLTLQDAGGQTLLSTQHVQESAEDALDSLQKALKTHLNTPLAAVGHRVVHGGPHLRNHQKITPELLQTLEKSIHFAPLHIPEAVRIIKKTQELFPDTPQFACFDTTFHQTLPPVAKYLPIPAKYFKMGIQRYGFHGLSCESVMHRLAPHPPPRLIIAHLGGGSSVTAVRGGESVDTTMGLSPTGGIPMATRSGDLDPTVLLYLLRSERLSSDGLEQFVNHACGLSGLSGGEADMRALLARVEQKDAAATLAVDLFTTDVRKQIGAYFALLGGVDLLVFTGGIGEHSVEVRKRILTGLGHLGLSADKTSAAKVMAVPAEEEVQIARHCRALLADA